MDVSSGSPGTAGPPPIQPPLGGAAWFSIPPDRTGINDASGAVWALPPLGQASPATRGNSITDLKQMLSPHAFVTLAAHLIDNLPNDQFSLVLSATSDKTQRTVHQLAAARRLSGSGSAPRDPVLLAKRINDLDDLSLKYWVTCAGPPLSQAFYSYVPTGFDPDFKGDGAKTGDWHAENRHRATMMERVYPTIPADLRKDFEKNHFTWFSANSRMLSHLRQSAEAVPWSREPAHWDQFVIFLNTIQVDEPAADPDDNTDPIPESTIAGIISDVFSLSDFVLEPWTPLLPQPEGSSGSRKSQRVSLLSIEAAETTLNSKKQEL